MQISCDVLAGYRNERTGLFSPVCEQKNLVLYQGADIIASLLAGDRSGTLSHMYFAYQNKAADASLSGGLPEALDRTMGRSWFNGVTGASPAYEDWLRVPIITAPRQFISPSNSTNYQSNGLYLTATSAASETMQGESPAHNYFGVDQGNGPSTVFGAALVAARNPSLSSQDRVFSRVTLSTPLTFVSGSQIVLFWSVAIS